MQRESFDPLKGHGESALARDRYVRAAATGSATGKDSLPVIGPEKYVHDVNKSDAVYSASDKAYTTKSGPHDIL